MSDIVFDGDDFTRSAARGGEQTSVARSSVADFLLSRRLVKSERQARWIAASIAALAIALVAASASWASRALGATPVAKSYEQMSAAERSALPTRHRLYLERLQQEAAVKKDREINDRFRPADKK